MSRSRAAWALSMPLTLARMRSISACVSRYCSFDAGSPVSWAWTAKTSGKKASRQNKTRNIGPPSRGCQGPIV